MSEQLSRWLIGDPIPSSAEVHQRLSKRRALAVFAADALSSVAYAPEEILLALALGSTMLFQFTLPIALSIVVLLVIVSISYYQTIHAYPSGGGAYTVAHENLGTGPGLLAAAALLIDYILVVAVSASAGWRCRRCSWSSPRESPGSGSCRPRHSPALCSASTPRPVASRHVMKLRSGILFGPGHPGRRFMAAVKGQGKDLDSVYPDSGVAFPITHSMIR